MHLIEIDGAAVTDAVSFHNSFATAFGFPTFYGRNLDAWIDCMSCLDEPESGMSLITVAPSEILVIQVRNADIMKKLCPELWLAFLECVAFANWRRVEQGAPPLLSVSASAS